MLNSCRVVGTEERIPIPLMDYILNVVSNDQQLNVPVLSLFNSFSSLLFVLSFFYF